MGLLEGALSIGGQIFGGIAASKAMKNVKNNLNRQRAGNEDWYNRRYNEDATQRADAQAILARTEEGIKNRNRQAAGAQAVMGGTEESVASTKAANNRALADATANIAVNAEARKDRIEQQYQAKDEALQQQLNDLEMKKADEISKAAMGVMQTGGNILS